MQARRLLPSLVAVAIFSTSCASIASLSGPAGPSGPVPLVDTTVNTEAAFPDDGLTRLIVTPIAGAPLPSATSTVEVESGSVRGAPSVSVDPSRVLTPEMVAAMPPGAALEARDGEVGYIDEDGNFVAFDQAMLAPEPTVPVEEEPEVVEQEIEAEVVPLYGNPYIDALAADEAIEKVTVIGDGTFGIETSDPSVIDPTTFESVADVPFGIMQDQYEPYQWHLENSGTNLERLGEIAQVADADLDIDPTLGRSDGSGVVVAVIDTGVDFSHTDLENSAWSNLGEVCDNDLDDDGNGFVDDCSGWDFAYNDAEPYNSGADSHGTHVAGIITANRDDRGVVGVAPAARIMDLNVATTDGSMSGAAVTAAIRYAVDNGADIINMSLGTNPGASAAGLGGMLDAIDYADAMGVLVVVAAGNSNVDLNSLAVYPASFNRSNMMVVGASAPDDTKASFSNHSADIVDLYAPGVYILSTTPGQGYYFMSGTSQASPATAGIAALVMETSPEASVDDVITQLITTVDPVDTLSTSFANGRLNAASALGLGEALPIPSEMQVLVAGLVGTENEVTAEVEIRTPPQVFDEAYHWELSLIQSSGDGAYAIIDHPFVIAGAEMATGLTGALVLGPSEIESVAVSTLLPDGQYSFLIESIPDADGSQRLGDAFVTTFEVNGGAVTVEEATAATTAPTSSTTVGEFGDAGGATNEGSAAEGSTTTASPDAASGESEATTEATDATGSAGDEASTTPTTAVIVEPGTPVSTAPQAAPTTAATPTESVPSSELGAPSTTAASGGGATGDPATDNTVEGATPDGAETPTTTSPPNTVPVGPAPVPPNVGDDSAVDGEWEITSISPQAGYAGEANSLTIRGSFPDSAYVWFGDQPGEVIYQATDVINVRTPRRPAEGIVDLTLRTSGAGIVLEVPDAYAFVGTSGGQTTAPGDAGSGTTGDSEGTGSDSGTDASTGEGGSETDAGSDTSDGGDSAAGGDNGTTDSDTSNGGSTGGDTTDDDSGGSDDSSDGGSTDGDAGSETSTSDRRSRMIVGSGVVLANGLTGAAISPNPAANAPACTADPCTASRS